jgi:outer membrane receptor protein involved in Fe transport
LTAQAGLRYTHYVAHGEAGSLDSPNGVLGGFFNGLFASCNHGVPPAFTPGGVITVNSTCTAQEAISQDLNENNTSWRGGLNWQLDEADMAYFNVSRGFKAGALPVLEANTAAELTPVKQETLTQYEIGLKYDSSSHRMRAAVAAFYDDYKNKQFDGRVLDPLIGNAERLINISSSYVDGAEAELTSRPVGGLTASASATYLHTVITGSAVGFSTIFDAFGNVIPSLKGEAFPYTPTWQANMDLQYEWPIGNNLKAFLEGSEHFQTSATTGLGEGGYNSLLNLNEYATLDLRAGLMSDDDQWRVTAFGRNVTNKYYWNNATIGFETLLRFTGQPQSWGIEVAYRFGGRR